MTEFLMRLDVRSAVHAEAIGPFDDELDNIISVLHAVCGHLAAAPGVAFMIGGFGQARWPSDGRTDLCVVLEQLPSVIRALEEGSASELDLYEQGLERTLRFDPKGSRVDVTCSSRCTSFEPAPATVALERSEVVAMLRRCLDTFVLVLHESFPAIANHPWVVEWLADGTREPEPGHS